MRMRRTAASACAGWWQNTLMLNGRSVSARVSRIILRAPSAFVAPTPSEPSPPAFDTAAASAGVLTPAIGAWTIGARMPSVRSSVRLSVD